MGRGGSIQRPLALVAHEGFGVGLPKGWEIDDVTRAPSWVIFKHVDGLDRVMVRSLQGMKALLVNEEKVSKLNSTKRSRSAHCLFDQKSATCKNYDPGNFEPLHATFARVASGLGVRSVEELKLEDITIVEHSLEHINISFSKSLTSLDIVSRSEVLIFNFLATLEIDPSVEPETDFVVNIATVEVILDGSVAKAHWCVTCSDNHCFHMRALKLVQDLNWDAHDSLLLSCVEDITDQ